MKKLLFILSFILSGLMVQSQSATVIHNAPQLAAGTLSGIRDTETFTFPIVLGEYDVSLQLIPATTLAGDSSNFSYIPYQSNSASAAVWTALAAADTVDTATDSDAIYEITDFKGLRLKVICTQICGDTSTITPYWVYKKHAQE